MCIRDRSISSNPASRRSSLASTSEGNFGSSTGNADTNHMDNGDDGSNVIHEFLLPQIQELTDSMITLDGNLTRLNFIHESLVDLNESIGSLLYGLMCNSWCVEFPNVPHVLERELRTVKRIEWMKAEKKSLQEQIANIRNGNDNNQNISKVNNYNNANKNQKGSFNPPLFPSTQGRTTSRNPDNLSLIHI